MIRSFLVVEKSDPLVKILDNYSGAHGDNLLPLPDLASRAHKGIREFKIQEETQQSMKSGNPERTRYYPIEPMNGHKASELEHCGVNPMTYYAHSTGSGRFKGLEGL